MTICRQKIGYYIAENGVVCVLEHIQYFLFHFIHSEEQKNT